MRRPHPLLPVCALLLAAAGCCSREAPPASAGAPPPAPDDSPRAPEDARKAWRVVVLGDSITAWGGGRTGYVTRLEAGLAKRRADRRVELLNAGVPGDTSADMLRRFAAVLASKPDLVCISAGVNDVWQGSVSREAYARNLAGMVRRARAAGAEICLFTPTPFEEASDSALNGRLARYCEAVRALAREERCLLADMNAAFLQAKEAAPRARLTTDGVHMNAAGNALMAQVALEALGAILGGE